MNKYTESDLIKDFAYAEKVFSEIIESLKTKDNILVKILEKNKNKRIFNLRNDVAFVSIESDATNMYCSVIFNFGSYVAVFVIDEIECFYIDNKAVQRDEFVKILEGGRTWLQTDTKR